MSDLYIVVLHAEADVVRALLFDGEARRVEGYSAQLPRRAEAEADCLDEMHRLVQAAGLRVAAVTGFEGNEEDRSYWPAFAGAAWFPALPDGAGVMLGSGCVGRERFGLAIGEKSLLGMVIESQIALDGLNCVAIDDKRWLVSCEVPEATGAYAALKRELRVKGSIEGFLETAAVDDPHLAWLAAVERRFCEIFERLKAAAKEPVEVIACGATLLKSPSWTLRMANALGVPLTLCTEPEPAARGEALWALERIGAIENLEALPASTATVIRPVAATS
jgi:hypothetical protein